MALTESQRAICRLIARNRMAAGESYVAVAAALNELIGAARMSRDIDLFHDTEQAVDAAWTADREVLEQEGYDVRVVRERPSFIEAEIGGGDEPVLMQWARVLSLMERYCRRASSLKGGHRMLEEARDVISALPVDEAGKCVLEAGTGLYRGLATEVVHALRARQLSFHAGRIRGALPQLLRAD